MTNPSGAAGAATATAAPRTRAEGLAAALEQRIIRDGLAAGDWLGTLAEIREESGVARATASEAVRMLRERGILEIRPGRGGGLFVAQPHPAVRLRHTLLTVRDAPVAVLDAIALREALEELINQDAARHRTQRDVADLGKLLTRLERAVRDPEAFMRANWALHERIAVITPNTMASAVYRGALGHVASSSSAVQPVDRAGYLQGRYAIHEELVGAITDGDAERVTRAVLLHNTTAP